MIRSPRLMLPAALAGLALAVAATPATAQPEGPDRTFGDRGTTVVPVTPGWPDGRVAVDVAPGGAVVSTFTSGGNLTVARHTAAGRPDPAFGTGGSSAVAKQAGRDVHSGQPAQLGTSSGDVLALRDGTVLAAGAQCTSTTVCYSDTLVARLNGLGALDPGFGAQGRRLAPVGQTGDSDDAMALALDAGGRVLTLSHAAFELASGRHWRPSIHVQRFFADGTPDATFGDGGHADITGDKLSTGRAFAVDAAGRILVGAALYGDEFTDFTHPVRVYRLTADGRLDPTWQGHRIPGFAERPAGPPRAVVPQADGTTLVVLGAELLRLRADGTLDAAFGGGDGRVDLPAGFDARAAVAAPGGGLLVAGGSGGDLALLELGADGTRARGGKALHAVDLPGGRTGAADDVALAPDGRVVLAGRAVEDGAVVLARLVLKRAKGGRGGA